ncbi:MAG: TrmB family transcriptional regulator [Candidatus Nanoarchaeia archaeon]
MIEENLELLGLTGNEIKIYLVLLKNKELNGSELRRKTKIANSQIYASLDNLIIKGLVTYKKYATGKTYSAVNPSVLKTLAEERQKKIESAIPFLKQLQLETKEETKTAIYEGFQGFKNALHRMVDECPANETVFILGFSNQAYKNEKLAALLRDVNKISIRKKHKFKMILDNRDNKFFQRRKQEGISELRFMGEGYVSPAAIDIFKDSVYIFLWNETPFAFVIENKNVAAGFRSYFEFMWRIAKK